MVLPTGTLSVPPVFSTGMPRANPCVGRQRNAAYPLRIQLRHHLYDDLTPLARAQHRLDGGQSLFESRIDHAAANGDHHTLAGRNGVIE
jgi:hypothetical protein